MAYIIRFIFMQKNFVIKIFVYKYFRIIYVNDCSIRVAQNFLVRNFRTCKVRHTKIILQQKVANYAVL